MEQLKKYVLGQQQTGIRSLTLYFSDQLSNIQAHYLATVLVSTLSEAILFVIACGTYFGMRALPMYIYSDYEAMARHHASKTMSFEAEYGILVEKSWQVGIFFLGREPRRKLYSSCRVRCSTTYRLWTFSHYSICKYVPHVFVSPDHVCVLDTAYGS